MDRLAVRLLGKPALTFDGKPLKWKAPPKTLPLLAILALHRGGALARRALAVALWPGELESDGLTRLRRHVYHIGNSLPPAPGAQWLINTRDSVAWNEAAPAWFDVRAFRDAIAQDRIYDAIDLYRGDLLEGWYEELVLGEREQLRASFLNALTRAIRERHEERNYATAIEYAEKLLTLDEWNEEAIRELMSAKYESGDRSAALATYERFARRLQEEFSVSPTPETSALREAIRAGLPLVPPASITLQGAPARTSRGWTLPFVGRSGELQTLTAAWSRAARGTGTIAFVSGEAGVGKSRLAAELANVVDGQGGSVLVGTTAAPEAEPYQALLVALRAALPLIASGAAADAPWLPTLGRILPEVHSLREGLTTEDELPAERAQQRLFEAIRRSFEHVGRIRPLCIVLEDLHWAGPATVDLLGWLARRIGTLPILILATYRSEEAALESPLRRLRAVLAAEQRAMAVPLPRLDRDDVMALVQARVPDPSAQSILGERVAALSEGNPLFASQLVEGFVETGEMPDAAVATKNVADAIAARASRLDASVRTVAEIAAAIGERFRADVVADVGGLSEDAVLHDVGELMDRGLVREAGGSTLHYAFSHALVASTIYELSPPGLRSARHRRIAGVLERLAQDDPSGVAAVARHWQRGGDAARAGTAYLNAARSAMDRYAREEAIALAREALALSTHDGERFEAALLVSQAQDGHGDSQRWRNDINVLVEIAKGLDLPERFAALEQEASFFHQVGERTQQRVKIDDMLAMTADGWSPERRCKALYALGTFHEAQAQSGAALASLHEALTIAVEQRADDDVREIRFALAHIHVRNGEYAQAQEHIERLNEVLQRRPSARGTALVLQAVLAVALWQQNLPAAVRPAGELFQLAQDTGDLELEIQALLVLGWVAQGTGDVAAVRSHYTTAASIARRLAYAQAEATALVDGGQFEAYLGAYDRALEHFDRAMALLRPTNSVAQLGFCLANRSRALRAVDRIDESLESAREAWSIANTVSLPRLTAYAGQVLGEATFAVGDHEAGLAMMRDALALRRALGNVPGLCTALIAYLDALVSLGRAGDLSQPYDELRALFETHTEIQEDPANTCYALAVGARGLGLEAAALAHLKRAESTIARLRESIADEETVRHYDARKLNRAVAALLRA